jgi:hypothetical protein
LNGSNFDSQLPQNYLHFRKFFSCGKPILGKECKKQGITEVWLLNPTEINVDFVNRELALELRSYKNRNQILDKRTQIQKYAV